MIPLRHIVVLLCLFALTVAIRWPNLGRPLSKHHEFCTATALRVLTVWHQEGIATMGYNPATNFAGTANKYINNHASGSGKMVDAQGNYYYVSHPHLAYYLPYAVFSLLNIEPDVLPLQYFHLFINLLCGFGIYLLARRLLPGVSLLGLVAAVVYWFAPAVLWFQSNVYMSDMMAQPFYIAALLVVLYVKDAPSTVNIVVLSIVCFLGTYTTWFGLLVAASLSLYFLYLSLNRPVFLWVAVCLMLSQALALLFIGGQYSQIAGCYAYVAELLQRFGLRGSVPNGMLEMPVKWAINYFANYGAILIFVPVLFMVKWLNGVKTFALYSLLPILLMHVLLANYTGHDFTTLYLAVPLSILVSMVGVGQSHVYKRLLLAFAGVCMVSGFMFYQLINPYGPLSYNGNRYNTYKLQGNEIAGQPNGAVVFTLGYTLSPEVLWYAKRNVLKVNTEREAIDFLKARKINTGVIFPGAIHGELQKPKIISLQPN